MDQKQKQISGPRFNIFDFLIILALVICFGAIIARVIFISNVKENIVFADVYFEVSDISDVTAEALHTENETIYLRANDAKIGVLTEISVQPYTVLTEDENGVLVEAVHPDKKTVRGKAQIKGVWYADGFLVEGTYLAAVGESFEIYTKYVSCVITVTGIAEKQ
jgi:hypothetical protein